VKRVRSDGGETLRIGSVSAGSLGARYRAFAWREMPDDTTVGSPLFVIDGDSLGEVLHEMLLRVRGEKPWPT